jgi:hypothetical protein
MISGIWLIVIVPAVLSFVFSVWVTISIMADVAERGGDRQSASRQNVGQGVVKLKLQSLLHENNNP